MPNDYDRIIKENFRAPTITLMQTLLGIDDIEPVILPTELHKTIEKKVDMLCRVTPAHGKPYLILLEWQTRNDPLMCARMLYYFAMLHLIYPAMEIRNYVIYIGGTKANMRYELTQQDIRFSYKLIDVGDFSIERFLDTDQPEIVLLALLAGRGQNRVSRQGIRRILNKLHVLLKHDPGKLKEKVIQLEMLGKLRKVQNLIIEEERNMPIHYNLKTDIRYMQGKEAGKNSGFRQGVRKGIKQGLEKGLKEAERHSIRKLLLKTTLDPKKIAEVLEVSVNKVLAVKRELN